MPKILLCFRYTNPYYQEKADSFHFIVHCNIVHLRMSSSFSVLCPITTFHVSNCTRFSDSSARERSPVLDSFGSIRRCKNSTISNNTKICSSSSSVVATPPEQIVLSSEQKVHDVVLKQAALVQRPFSKKPPQILLPRSQSMLNEAYDRCRQVCAEYAKTFYLGTLLMTPQRRKAIWAIYGDTLSALFRKIRHS